MSIDLPSFQRYQLAFTKYIRDPQLHPCPQGIVAKRMAVYKEIVFNNLYVSVSACFPVTQKVLGKRAWLKLIQAFLRDHAANTPIFRQIPEEFLNFLSYTNVHANTNVNTLLPPYLVSLCHYEWIELLVASMPISLSLNKKINPTGNLLSEQPVFTPTMQLLHYDYAVHKISPRNKPEQKQSTYLLVYRNNEDLVKFIELNAVTFRLLTLLQQNKNTSEQALTLLANELAQPFPETVINFGLETLEKLRSQGVILGTVSFSRGG